MTTGKRSWGTLADPNWHGFGAKAWVIRAQFGGRLDAGWRVEGSPIPSP